MATSILQRFVDADQWAAEDMVGRLGMVMHAAFLFAGFHPYGAQPSSAGKKGTVRLLSRWYTAPELVAHRRRRKGTDADADAAVLMLCEQGSDIALLVFLVTAAERRDAPSLLYLERLDRATVAPLLSCALRRTEPWGSRICRELAGGVCSPVLAELCSRNGGPLASFMSLPHDMVEEILRKLADAEDLEAAACTCRELRQLVAARDAQLWKPLCEALPTVRRRRRTQLAYWWFFPDFSYDSESEPEEEMVISWKQKYVQAKPLRPWPRTPRRLYFDLPSPFSVTIQSLGSPWTVDYWFTWPSLPEPETVPTTGRDSAAGHRRRKKMARNENYSKKRQRASTVHTPSSRYRWKHR